MGGTKSKPGAIHLKIIEVLKRFPSGATGGQIRQELEREGLRAEDQTHLDRRKRDLKKWFEIERISTMREVRGSLRRVTLYKYIGPRTYVTDEGELSLKVRAEIIHLARGKCQMCGKSIQKHGIALVVDHKRPRDWGGVNSPDNLWAICEECNAGKKAYFSSLNVDHEMMKRLGSHKSVHVRIGELLKAVGVGKRTPSYLLQIIADQDDWHKRLRELRYPVIGWEIEKVRFKPTGGRTSVDYVLRIFRPWPTDPSGTIRRYEREREVRNRRSS